MHRFATIHVAVVVALSIAFGCSQPSEPKAPVAKGETPAAAEAPPDAADYVGEWWMDNACLFTIKATADGVLAIESPADEGERSVIENIHFEGEKLCFDHHYVLTDIDREASNVAADEQARAELQFQSTLSFESDDHDQLKYIVAGESLAKPTETIITRDGISNGDDDYSICGGSPFGEISKRDVESLMEYAAKQDMNLEEEFERAYQGDMNALSRVFAFSLKFSELDRNARSYAHAIYSSLLNTEGFGIGKEYLATLASQPEAVQQRIRDIFYFPITRVPKKERAEVERELRTDFAWLYPADYEFGKNDPVFVR